MSATLKFAVPVAWSIQSAYEINTIVFIGKRAFTALQNVPTGVEITNTSYWKETGVPYLDVQNILDRLDAVEDDIDNVETSVATAQQDIITNANNITQLTTNLSQAVTNLNNEIARVDNIMITLYTPVTSS